jgi:SAM-dependent methyltransferase
MPTSDFHNIAPVLTVVRQLEPRSVLDVGCGFGKYGMLLREYLDVWYGRVRPDEWQVRLEAIEAFEPYRNPVWVYVYQAVHLGEAAAILPRLGRYDVILLLDVIEHLDSEAARTLATLALGRARAIVVSTPRDFYPQEDENQNPYERHRCLWTAADFPPGTHVTTIPLLSCNLFVASNEPMNKWSTYPADPRDVLFLMSRNRLKRLGKLGWPISAALRAINRWVA